MTIRHRNTSGTAGVIATIIGLIVAAGTAHAQTTFFEAGFEASEGYSSTIGGAITVINGAGDSTTFDRAPGALLGQPSTNPRTYRYFNFTAEPLDFATTAQRGVNSTRVVDTVAASGSQSVLMDGNILGSERLLYYATEGFRAGTNGVLSVATDLRVNNPSATAFGQWGVEVLSVGDNGVGLNTVAAFGAARGGVLATNDSGDIYAAISLSTFQPLVANYGEFNNYQLQLDYGSRTIRGLFNNSLVGFIPIDANGQQTGDLVISLALTSRFGDRADYVTFGQERPDTTETANFDNFRITGTNVTVVPEAGTLVLVLPMLGMIGAVVRRRNKSHLLQS